MGLLLILAGVEKHKKLMAFLAIALPLLPLLIAFIAYYQIYSSMPTDSPLNHIVGDALYSAIRIYGVCLDMPREARSVVDQNVFWMLEIARWGAMIAIATAVIKLLQNTMHRISTSILAKGANSIALYGDKASVAMLKTELGYTAISKDCPEKFRAANHLLAFRDTAQMYDFISEHYAKLFSRKDSRVFIYSSNPIHPSALDPHIFVNNMAEACSRSYWKKYWLKPNEKKIALIGFGSYGGYLLTQALQVNVFLTEKETEYHVFGDSRQYQALHSQLTDIVSVNEKRAGQDAVFFHELPWYDELNMLKSMDRVILCMDTDAGNMRLIDLISDKLLRGKIHVRITNGNLLRVMGQNSQSDVMVSFGTDQELFKLDQVTNSTLLTRGKMIHACYCREACIKANCHNSKDCRELTTCMTCRVLEKQWNSASIYSRSSSVAQADHIPVKVRELLNTEVDDTGELAAKAYDVFNRMDDAHKEPWLQMEHRRWMRFMALHGWSYGSVRDNDEKKHTLLVPFNQLPPNEIHKDELAYEILEHVEAFNKVRKEILRHV